MSGPLRVLLFSTLYPSSARPGHGIFVETRLRELLSEGGVEAKVLAPVPWFPSASARWGNYARMAATPLVEHWQGIEVHHPRYCVIPKVGMNLAPALLAAGSLRTMQRLIDQGFDFDVLDAHYYFPDGVAAAWLARRFGKPLTITARGSDLNLIGTHPLPRRMMQWAARQADASIGVSGALVDVFRSWQLDESKLRLISNGVDLVRFCMGDRATLRALLGLGDGPVLLSVGNLLELKGHHLVVAAMSVILGRFPTARLVIVGDGPERASLQAQVDAAGLQDRVLIAGPKPQSELPQWYGAADALVLASSREGWPNVLLEAMACGTPVVATRVGGVPEVIRAPVAGQLIDRRDAPTLAAAVLDLLSSPPSREQVRRYAEGFGWSQSSQAQRELFAQLTRRSEAADA